MSQSEISESIKVYIRQRPDGVGIQPEKPDEDFNWKESSSGVKSVSADGKTCTYYSATSKMHQHFAVDRYFLPDTQQAELFDTIALPIVDSAMLGYSGTIMAYGPTSSGKTHTMRGALDEDRGIMPRCIERLLAQQAQSGCEIWASYLQIYCETITDLLRQPGNKESTTEGNSSIIAYSANQPLLLRDKASTSANTSTAGVYVEGLSRYKIQSVDDLWELLQRGDMNRSTAATNMNETSSRSHAVLMVKIVTKDDNSSNSEIDSTGAPTGYRESTLMLVDLAGSERAAASEGKSVLRAEEAKAINLSLSALGNCMNALATASEGKSTHIPYRDSKLTRLLQGCLGGGARTAVVVTLAPGTDTAGESLSALRFASRASKVSVKAHINQYKDYEALYREMKVKLKEFQSGASGAVDSAQQRSIGDLQSTLKQKDSTLAEQALEISMLKQQLAALQSNSNNNGASGAGVGSTKGPDASAPTPVISTAGMSAAEVEQHWAAKLDATAKQHVVALEAAHRTFQITLRQAQQGEQTALREVSAKQEDIKNERERNLSTMRMLRENTDRRGEEENLYKARIAELLSELSTLRDSNDDLQNQNESLLAQLKVCQEKFQELDTALFNSVSKAQVKEMESLFIETVTRLSDRVNLLEGKRPASNEGGSTYNSNNSAVASSSGAGGSGSREVRIEPGGRIRASTSTKAADGTGNNGISSGGSNKYAGNSTTSNGSAGLGAGLQHSQSASAVPPASSVTSGSSKAGGLAPVETKGKLW